MTRKPSAPPSVHSTANGDPDFPFGANATPDRPAGSADGTAEEPAPIVAEPAATEQLAAAAGPVGPDPFDPAALRLSQDFTAAAGVKKALLTVPVRKPHKSWFIRVHPEEAYRLPTAVIEVEEGQGTESYLVVRSLWDELAAESTFRRKLLATAINRQGVLFLWEVNLPRSDGRVDEWSRSAQGAVALATKGWVRVVANQSLGAYEVFQASGQLVEPEWPSTPFADLLRIAFRDRHISSRDHPILRRLRGEV